MKVFRCWLLGLGLALSGLSLVGPAQAHGGGTPQLVNAPFGPHLLSVWTNPDPPRVGVVHVTVALAERVEGAAGIEAGAPVLDRPVTIALIPPEGGTPLTTRATHEAAENKLLYETDVRLEQAGLWEVRLQTDAWGPQSFILAVQPAAAFPWPVIAAAALAAAGVIWFRSRSV